MLHPRLFLFTGEYSPKLSRFPHAIHIFFLTVYEKISFTFFLKFDSCWSCYSLTFHRLMHDLNFDSKCKSHEHILMNLLLLIRNKTFMSGDLSRYFITYVRMHPNEKSQDADNTG